MALILLSHSEQIAAHLRTEIMRGRWSGLLPGAPILKEELGVNHNTIDQALKQLEVEGLLVSQGVGKPRRIVMSGKEFRSAMRIQIMVYDASARTADYMIELRHQLVEAGYAADFASKTLQDLGMNVKRVANFVNKTPAEAWVVAAGSKDVLEWFIKEKIPAFALFGNVVNLPIAATGPKKSTAMLEVVRKLIHYGHKRIVMLTREERRNPQPAFFEQAFLNELAANGIATSKFNLPDWEENVKGLHALLRSLFARTPPTALLVSEMPFFLAAQQYLARQGIIAPRDVSLVSLSDDPSLAWFDPPITHVTMDSRPWVKRIVQWASHISLGKVDLHNGPTHATLVEGGTIGPVSREKR